MSNPPIKICVIIPALNEAEAIGAVVGGVRGKGFDALVIDDGSSDGTGRIAQETGAVVLRNEQKSGKGFSLQRGFDYALNQGYTGVITMDGDGQHAAADLDGFIAQIQAEPDTVITGSRMANPKGMPLVRRCTNWFMSWLVSCLCRQTVPDTQCGYRYISSEILRQLKFSSSAYEIETEVLVKASKKGYRVISVPVRTIYSNEVSKIHPFKDTLRFLRYLWREFIEG